MDARRGEVVRVSGRVLKLNNRDDGVKKKRNYKKEYREYHGTPKQMKNRAKRNKARKVMGLKVGDKREVDHKVPLKKGGSNSKRNLRVVSRKTNRRKGAK